MSGAVESEVEFEASDGWPLAGVLRVPAGAAGGAVFVPGSRHERDAWTDTAVPLAALGFASLCIDIRGRGASTGSMTYSRMPVGMRRRVALDVGAALNRLGAELGSPRPLAVVAEQDTAPDAATAAAEDTRVRAIAVLSARGAVRMSAAVTQRPLAVYGIVSSEDRAGVRATVDAYLAGAEDSSRLDVFDGLGIGITMASILRFERPDAETIESMVAGWLAERLAA